jgi:hypothetical protein
VSEVASVPSGDAAPGAGGVVVGQTSPHGPAKTPAGEAPFDAAAARAEAAALLSAQESLEGREGADTPDTDPAGEPKPAAKPAETKPEPEGDEDENTRRWVRLRNQEKRFNDRIAKERGEFNKERETFAKERETFQKEHESFKAAKARASKEPLSALKELGWSFEQLVDYVQKNGQVPQERIINDLKLSMDEEMQKTRAELEEIKNEKKTQERQQRINGFQQKVVDEVRTTIDGFPNLKRFLDKHGPEKVIPKVLWKMETEAKVKNYLTPSQVMGMFEDELSQVASLYETPSPAPGGAGQGPANPEAAKPRTRPEPLSNDDGSERGVHDVDDDDDDPIARRRRAKALLAG